MKKALIVIDPQKDYFSTGKFPLWNTEAILENIEKVIKKANKLNIPIVLVQHVVESSTPAPFFNKGSEGVEIHPRVLQAAPNAKIIVKAFADSFYKTSLEEILTEIGAEELVICGMMTQNCVTHTAISKSAEKYKVRIITDCCTTVNEIIHQIALRAISTRIELLNSDQVFV